MPEALGPLEDGAWTRRQLLARGATLAAGASLAGRLWLPGAGPQPAHAAADGPGAAHYWAVMDEITARMEDRWSEEKRAYNPTRETHGVPINASMLQVHATAALYGHRGASRNDHRIRLLVQRLCASPAPFRERGTAAMRKDKMFHAPGWVATLDKPESHQDKSFDPKISEALEVAARAAAPAGLTGADVGLIADRVIRTARGRFFRYPAVRLNQINWHCDLYAMATRLGDDGELLRRDYRLQVLRFLRHATRRERGMMVPNLGSGYHFHYLPQRPRDHGWNLDSAEYANETIHFVQHHREARAAGMPPLPDWAQATLRAWTTRVLCGYWNHAGSLNWDTGLGFARWHMGKTLAFAGQGLVAIASTPEFHDDEHYAGWARWFLDRGLTTYLELAGEKGLAEALPYIDGPHKHSGVGASLYGARTAANAARAIDRGLHRIEPLEPPPLYAWDPDTSRLAVTTPRFSTAFITSRQRAVPYGGTDPARIYDSHMRVLGAVGGRGAGNVSARLVGPRGGVLLDTTSGRSKARVTGIAAQRGGSVRRASTRSADYPRRPFAGPFDRLAVAGLASRGRMRIRTDHEIRADGMTLRWDAVAPAGRRIELVAHLPVWDEDAMVTARLHDGSERTLAPGQPAIAVADVAHIVLATPQTSWSVGIASAPDRAILSVGEVPRRARGAGAQRAVRISGRTRGGRGRISVRYAF